MQQAPIGADEMLPESNRNEFENNKNVRFDNSNNKSHSHGNKNEMMMMIIVQSLRVYVARVYSFNRISSSFFYFARARMPEPTDINCITL